MLRVRRPSFRSVRGAGVGVVPARRMRNWESHSALQYPASIAPSSLTPLPALCRFRAQIPLLSAAVAEPSVPTSANTRTTTPCREKPARHSPSQPAKPMTVGNNRRPMRLLPLVLAATMAMVLMLGALVDAVAPVGDVPLGCILPLTGNSAGEGLRAKVTNTHTHMPRDAVETQLAK